MMIKRSKALYNDEIIGIESIYTIRDGKQISIPVKTEELREKGKRNELFCPCGCKANLRLVAGLERRQHFRLLKSANIGMDCSYKEENEEAITSKIVLKCWLDDKLGVMVESRVPICRINNEEGKHEFSFLSEEKKIAVSYYYNLGDINDEKITILENNRQGVDIVYIVDAENATINNLQYPERLMKIQNRQGYCLLLSVANINYDEARLDALYCWENAKGLWEKTIFSSGLLKDYHFGSTGELFFGDEPLKSILEGFKKRIAEIIERDKGKEKEEQERRRLEREEQEKSRLEREDQERKSREKEEREKLIQEWEDRARRRREREEQEKIKEKAGSLNNSNNRDRDEQEEYKRFLETELSQQEKPAYWKNKRMVKCKFCGVIDTDGKFFEYGGAGAVNLGVCKECNRNDPRAKEELKRMEEESKRPKEPAQNSNICPLCGGQLKLRRYWGGEFIGCSNYPNCKYSRSKW